MGNSMEQISKIFEAIEYAYKANALLPPLPSEIKPTYIRILNAFDKIRDDDGTACISRISKTSGILLPNTTKLINELVSINVVEKLISTVDKRVVLVKATGKGEMYIQKYIRNLHQELERELSKISESDIEILNKTMQKIYSVTKNVYQHDNE
jgi:DNA-binding MarR family transcriptional regulator